MENKRLKKITLLTDGIYPFVIGGMQKHSFFLAKYFSGKNIEVDLYHYKPKGAPNQSAFSSSELENINLITIEYPKEKKFPGHYLYERYEYSKRVAEEITNRKRPDFIYAKGFSAWALLKRRQSLGIDTPIGVNFHGYEMFQRWPDIGTGLKLQILKLPVKYHIKEADYLFSYGGGISKIISSLGGASKIIEVPTGISSNWVVKEANSTPSEGRKFVFVGRAERRKGIKEINKVLSSMANSDFEFHFVGPIEDDDKVLKENIYYHGIIMDEIKIRDLLDDMDILVCPSYSEGMPNVIMEGMSRGLAIIATDVGAVSAMVDENNGWLIEGDIKKGLKNSIQNALKIPEEHLQKKKKSSIKKVRNNFTWERVINKTIKEIEFCLEQ